MQYIWKIYSKFVLKILENSRQNIPKGDIRKELIKIFKCTKKFHSCFQTFHIKHIVFSGDSLIMFWGEKTVSFFKNNNNKKTPKKWCTFLQSRLNKLYMLAVAIRNGQMLMFAF